MHRKRLPLNERGVWIQPRVERFINILTPAVGKRMRLRQQCQAISETMHSRQSASPHQRTPYALSCYSLPHESSRLSIFSAYDSRLSKALAGCLCVEFTAEDYIRDLFSQRSRAGSCVVLHGDKAVEML